MTKADLKEKAPAAAAAAPAEAKIPAEQKAAEKKAPVKKAAEKKAPKAAPKAADAVFVQFGEGEWETADLAARAKAAYVAEGHRASTIKSFRLYVKPEEGKAYYVINDKATGSIDL